MPRHQVNRFIKAGFALVRHFNNAPVDRVAPAAIRVVLRAVMADGQAVVVAAECAVARTRHPQVAAVLVESLLNHLFYR